MGLCLFFRMRGIGAWGYVDSVSGPFYDFVFVGQIVVLLGQGGSYWHSSDWKDGKFVVFGGSNVPMSDLEVWDGKNSAGHLWPSVLLLSGTCQHLGLRFHAFSILLGHDLVAV